MQQWQETFRADPEWYPSKTKDDAAPPGPKPIFMAQKKQVRVAEAGIEYQKASFIKEALVFRFPKTHDENSKRNWKPPGQAVSRYLLDF